MASGKDQSSLFYAGMVGLMDPPRNGCRQSIEIVQNANVSVKMITGDALETATSIGKNYTFLILFFILILGARLNIYKNGDNCLSGIQMDELTEMDLERCIRNVSIFYRVSPRHKVLSDILCKNKFKF